PESRRSMNQFYTSVDHFVLKPALMLALFGCSILLLDTWIVPNPKQRKYLLLIFVIPGLAFTAFPLWQQQTYLAANGLTQITAFQESLTLDGFELFFNWIFVLSALIVSIVSYKYLDVEGEHHGEYYGLILLAQCGMYFLAAGTDLITLFIGLELMALCFLMMVGFLRGERLSKQAAFQYLILGAFSSGFLAYCFSIMYGISGSTKLREIGAAIASRDPRDPVVLLMLATTSIGLLFKISAVP